MRRQEKWELEYRRNPYMASLSEEQLRDIFDEISLSKAKIGNKNKQECCCQFLFHKIQQSLIQKYWNNILLLQVEVKFIP